MKLIGAWILLSAALAEGRLRKLGGVSQALSAAEGEVAAHMDTVIERAKNSDGWDVKDVVSKIDVRVSKILDAHGVDGAEKEMAMEHLDNRLSTMLEEISFNKEPRQWELSSDSMTDANDIKSFSVPTSAPECTMVRVETVTDSFPEEISWEIKLTDGTVIYQKSQYSFENANHEYNDSMCLDWREYEFWIEDEGRNGICCSLGHGGYKIFVDNEEVASGGQYAYKDIRTFGVPTNEPRTFGLPTNEPRVEEMKTADDFASLQAAETEVAARMDAVIKRAEAADGWNVDDVLRKVNVGVGKILDDHAIGDAAKKKAIDHLNNKLSMMLEEISSEKESKLEMHSEAMMAAEAEVVALMDGIIEAAKAEDGWNTKDVVSNIDVGVNKILDNNGIAGTEREQAMDHFNNKLSKMLDEISAEQDWGLNL